MSTAMVKAAFVNREAAEPEWKAVHRTADRAQPSLARLLASDLTTIGRDVPTQHVVMLLRQRNPEGLFDRLPFATVLRHLEEVTTEFFRRLVLSGVRATLPVLGQQLGERVYLQKQQAFALNFDLVNALAVRHAQQMAASMVTSIGIETRMAIRELVVRSQFGEFDVRELARQVRQLVGPTQRQMRVLLSLRADLLAAGEPARTVREEVRRAWRRAVRQRATMIARTETIKAANRGVQATWEVAIQEGFLPREARRVWIATEDDRTCPYCSKMDGQVVAIDQLFVSPTVETSRGLRQLPATLTPPVHVLCRCAISLDVTSI